MKERDYINVRELGNVIAISNLFRDIIQANSEVITEEEYKTIGEILYQWQKKLYLKVKIKQLKMILEDKYIDELIDIRKFARENKNWKLSDEIRNYLDEKLVFIFDTKYGQEVWFMPKGSRITNRIEMEKRIKDDIRYNNNFDAWLYSIEK